MKKLLLLSLTLVVLLTVSCGSDKKNEPAAAENSTENNDQVALVLEFKTLVNDKFKIYYSKEPNVEIGGEHFIDKYIYGDDDMQKTVFKFPKGVFPYKIRLDVGMNQKVENITIKNISVTYKDKVLDGDEGEYKKFWSPNECLKFNETNFVYDLVPSNGLKSPVFMANVEFQKKLIALSK
ncbi:hypothetical protein [Flavobacterium sp.]|uniref:hypothetical protein n=1 Tax=Flavobacterium sp. TaxID=239 RepID=UPI00286C0693|nr:hypothetical protein [Flavobacterium sp.]